MTKETKEKRPRGRPRPQETVRRDNLVRQHLSINGPMTRNQLAESLGLSLSLTYLSLSRLRVAGLVRICGGASEMAVWTTEVDSPCP